MGKFFLGFGMSFVAGGALLVALLFVPQWWSREVDPILSATFQAALRQAEQERAKTTAELIAEAQERSAAIRGLYMTADVASDPGAGAEQIRRQIVALADATEINGMVIDVKEVCGPDYHEGNLAQLLSELHQKNIWTIARIVAFKDASQIYAHPEWYLKRASAVKAGDECFRKRHLRAPAASVENPLPTLPSTSLRVEPLWQDKRGGYWLDPASEEVREYLLEFSKKMVDLGFDELQFDYIRFPSDGDVSRAIYPAWDGRTPKHEVMRSFFEYLGTNLRAYKPAIILSADLFGYVAAQKEELSIGQRLEDIGNHFDYISFMVYPSHYYNGLELPADPARRLSAVRFSAAAARANPGTVVERSLLVARDFLDGKATTTSATSTIRADGQAVHRVRFRPWLEDFFHEEDRAAGRPYGTEKVRAQIEAALRVEPHGWLLWNAANVYTGGALRNEGE